MHFHELMGWEGPMTHLHFLMWMRWLGDQWNEPNRSDWYAIQTAAEVRQIRYSLSSKPSQVKLNDLKLPFISKEELSKPKTEEEILEEAKRNEVYWMARLGIIGPGARQPLMKRDPTIGVELKKPAVTRPHDIKPKARPKKPVRKPLTRKE